MLLGALQIVPQVPKSGVDKNKLFKQEVQLVGENEQVPQETVTSQSMHMSPLIYVVLGHAFTHVLI